jgi:hypothetical protein
MRRLPNFKPANVELVEKASAKLIQVFESQGHTSEASDVEEGSFELSFDGEEWAGGSYIVHEDGTIYICSIGIDFPIVGNANDSVETIREVFEKATAR